MAPSNFVDSGKIGGTVKDSGLGFNWVLSEFTQTN